MKRDAAQLSAVAAAGGDLGFSGVLPLARLKDSLGTAVTRQHVAFDPETNMLHTCCNEKRIR